MILVEILVAGLVLAAGYALGAALLARCGITLDGPLRRLIYRGALGLGALAYVAFAVGLLGLLRTWIVWPLVLGSLAVGWPVLRREAAARRRMDERTEATEVKFAREEQWPHVLAGGRLPRWATILFAGAAGWLGLWAVLRALLPPVAYDDLTYHLAAPSLYAASGRVIILPWDHHTAFPFTLEMLWTLCLVLVRGLGVDTALPPAAGAPAAQLVHVGVGLLAVLALWRLATDLFGPRTGWLAALIWASAPLVYSQFGSCYTELGYGLYQLVAWLALVEYLNLRCTTVTFGGGQPRPKARQPRWLPILGLAAGLCVGVKLTGVLATGFLVGAVVVLGWRDRLGLKAVRADALVVAVIAALVAAPWLARTWIVTGNPVFPFAHGVFDSPLWSDDRAAAYDRSQKDFGQRFELKSTGELALLDADPDAHRRLTMLPGALARLTFHPDWYFDRGNNFDGKAQLGPALATLLPLAILGWLLLLRRRDLPPAYQEVRDETVSKVYRQEFRREVAVPTTRSITERVTVDPARPLGLLLAHLVLMLGLWFGMMQYSRYLVPHLALWAIPAAWALDGLLRLRIAAGAGVILLVMQLGGGLAFAQRDKAALPAIAGGRAALRYVGSRTPLLDTYLATAARPGVRRVALYGEPRGLYLGVPYFWAERGHSTMIPDSARASSAAYVDHLVGTLGVSHAILAPAFPLDRLEGTDDAALIGRAVADGRFRPTDVPGLYEVR